MPNTRFKTSIEIETLTMSRHSMDKLLNRLAAKYTSESYDVLRCNCNHFTEDLCMAVCGKQVSSCVRAHGERVCRRIRAEAIFFEDWSLNSTHRHTNTHTQTHTHNSADPRLSQSPAKHGVLSISLSHSLSQTHYTHHTADPRLHQSPGSLSDTHTHTHNMANTDWMNRPAKIVHFLTHTHTRTHTHDKADPRLDRSPGKEGSFSLSL